MSKLIELYNNDESLSYENFENESISNLKFNFDNIEDTNFNKCKLENVSFNDQYLGNINFQNCEFVNCVFSNVNFEKVVFKDCKLTDVVFEKGKALDFEIIDSVVQYCHFSLESIINGKFDNRFTSCHLEGKLTKCNFLSSQFEDLKIENLICSEVSMENCKFLSIIGDINNFKGVTLSMTQALDLMLGIGIDIKELIQ